MSAWARGGWWLLEHIRFKFFEEQMSKPENRKLGRVRYTEGQMLRSADFQDIERVEAQRRWWHNRALHNAYGVYQGFDAATEKNNAGQTRTLLVTPGIAYDCYGRELVLDCAARVLIPSTYASSEGTLTLLIRYQDVACRQELNPHSSVCCTESGAQRAGTIEFVWADGTRIPVREGVVLGSQPFYKFRALPFLSFKKAPTGLPLARPKLGSGSTVPGNTAWQPWDFQSEVGNQKRIFSEIKPIYTEIGVQTRIDTSAAGFTEIPQYFAWLQGSIWNPQFSQLVPALFPSLANESIDGFTFRLLLYQPLSQSQLEIARAARAVQRPVTLIQDSGSFSIFARQQNLSVAWLGCQMPRNSPFVSPEKVPVPCGCVFAPEVLARPGWK
jgi:hypothetical protein